jgi:hypothetical protein
LPYCTALRFVATPDVRAVQVVASALLYMTPADPTAMNALPETPDATVLATPSNVPVTGTP